MSAIIARLEAGLRSGFGSGLRSAGGVDGAGGARGAGAGDLFYSRGRTLQIKAFRDQIASLTESDEQWISARAIDDRRMGTAYTERFDDESIERVARRARENAAFSGTDDGNTLFAGDENRDLRGDYDGRRGRLDTVTIDDKKAMTLSAERAAKAHDPRIVNVPYCYYGETDGEHAIASTHGVSKAQQTSTCACYVMVIARDGEETQTGAEFAVAADPSMLDTEAVARTAATRAIEKLGAQEIDSGTYRVVFDSRAASQLLGAFIASPGSPFFGETIQKGRSMLAGKLGTPIASQLFTVVDDPTRGLSPAFFDGDGVATSALTLVDRGTFAAVVHTVYSAAREVGASTTGHAMRGRERVSTGLHRPYLENGDGSLESLLSQLGSGILITEVEGLHAGLNTVTGDFSLSAKGFLVEGGIRGVPVRNVVAAGNFFDLASNLAAKAGDLRDDNRGGFDSPSVLIEALSVSGK
ncbi:MAG: TldD/PmbA family protein [Spirochaetaceae bacterium]|nr:MAG: TldD/PmbA family protein [Spirochaetaceae bacterium]